MVAEGDSAPQFTLTDDRLRRVKLSDFRGTRVVLWFYVRDDTAG